MSLSEQLERDYITAYKAKDSVTLGVLRLLKTALKNFQVEHLRPPVDGDIFDIITKQCKQRQDSIEQFSAVGRHELAEKEAAEMAVLRSYMPPALTAEELQAAIAAAITATGATGLKDRGRVMQSLMAEYKGRFDGKAASDAVQGALQQLASA